MIPVLLVVSLTRELKIALGDHPANVAAFRRWVRLLYSSIAQKLATDRNARDPLNSRTTEERVEEKTCDFMRRKYGVENVSIFERERSMIMCFFSDDRDGGCLIQRPAVQRALCDGNRELRVADSASRRC